MTKRPDFLNNANSFSRERLTHPYWRYAAIFIIGLVVGWLVFGWLLFPVKYTQVYPNELRPEAVNDYLLMTAESYAATHDLRTAAKRLRYWEPEPLAGMFNQLAQSVETANPASAAYLRVLARDLHLSTSTTSVVRPPSSSPPSRGFNFLWLLILILALVVLAALILLAQRFGLLGQRIQPPLQEADQTLDASPSAPQPEDVDFTDASPGQRIQPAHLAVPTPEVPPEESEVEDASDLTPEWDEQDEVMEQPYGQDIYEKSSPADEDMESVPDESIQNISEPDDLDIEPMSEMPEVIPIPPLPVSDETEPAEIGDEDNRPAPQVLRFDGDPSYNKIASIEPNDEYLGEYGLSASQTAPNNPNLVLTLEVWLFDKSDTQTKDIVLAPPVIVADPDLKARYVGENAVVLPLQEGQIIACQTAELRLDGRVRRVKFGAATSDGVPVIEYAEVELRGRRL